jgi:ATP-dependent DNA helicase
MHNLEFLLKKAGVYSSWLADKLESHHQSANKENSRKQPQLVVHEMRDYQIAGMEWLISMYDNGLNGILADEMGCGKTLQTLAFLAYLREMGTTGPFLIVAPLSTISNWIAESEKFTPNVPIVLYHGTPNERKAIRDKKFKLKKSFPIIVTSYEICMNDRKYLARISWKYIIIDEGHRLKNLNCKLIRELKKYDSANRLLLTGTPLQNNLSELWSLLNFLMPDIFGDLEEFEEWFEFSGDRGEHGDKEEFIDKSANLVSKLHEILRPFVLRRLKSQVVKELPQKLEYVIYAPLVPKQKELYQAALEGRLPAAIAANIQYFYDQFQYIDNNDTIDEIESVTSEEDEITVNNSTIHGDAPLHYPKKQKLGSGVSRKAVLKEVLAPQQDHIRRLVKSQNLQSTIMQLRKVCNHPQLFKLCDEDLMFQKKYFLPMIKWSGKMILLDQMLTALIDKGHKVLIFSQMTKMLDIIADYCEHVKNYKYGRIDGQVNAAERKADVLMTNV